MSSKWARSWACGLIGVLGATSIGFAQDAPTAKVVSPESIVGPSVLNRIREEGLNHSHAMETLSYLSDVIGPRLTGSPNLRRANEWTRSQFTQWGLENVHDEAWGPFGRGWELKRFSVQIVEPQAITLIAYPKAWSPGLDEPVEAPVVYIDARTEADLKKYEGKLRGAVVLMGAIRPVEARFEPLAARVTDSDLLGLADSSAGQTSPPGVARAANAAERSAQFANTPAGQRVLRGRRGGRGGDGAEPATGPATAPAGGRRGRGGAFGNAAINGRILAMAQKEGAALVIDPSLQGDGGTVFVAQATVPTTQLAAAGVGGRRAQPYSVDCPPMPPEATMAVEHYNRLVRMIQQGESLKMAVDYKVKYHADDLMAYNTIAEIPGTDPDLKDQLVMVGGHMDSWQSGTGATDNGVGVVAAMEAVRIIKALDLKPRRTIRIALWTGEEEGLLGSEAYVAKHFGHLGAARTGATTQPAGTQAGRGGGLVKEAEYDKLSCYFNLDNGTGKIRGIYMQANEAARPFFQKWIAPWGDLEARTLTPSNTGATDHISFDSIGLPGFQFIQDPIEYFSRTHHSSADVFDRIQGDDLKQAATVMAAILYDAAQMDERFPRKPMRNQGN